MTTWRTALLATLACGLCVGCQDAGRQAGKELDDAATAAKKAGEDAGDAAKKLGEAAGDEAKKLGEQAQQAGEDVVDAAKNLMVGEVNVGEKFTEFVSGLKGKLEGVTDVESAKAALPDLEEAETKLGEMMAMAGKLPEQAMPAFNGMVEKGRESIQPLIEKLGNTEGVKDVLQPVLDKITAKMAEFTGEAKPSNET